MKLIKTLCSLSTLVIRLFIFVSVIYDNQNNLYISS